MKKFLPIITLITICLFNIKIINADSEIQKDNLSNHIENYLTNNFVNAAFSFASSKEILAHGAMGVFSTDGKNLAANQIMAVASNTKSVTAAGILRLRDKKLLDVKDKISKYLNKNSDIWPDNKIPSWANNITIHQLLTHSSGLEEYFYTPNLFKCDMNKETITKKIVEFAVLAPLKFTPGSQYKYSNTNYVLLGLIIEKISGKKLKDFFDEEFFIPLEMNSTYIIDLVEANNIQKDPNSMYPTSYFVMPNNTQRPQFIKIDFNACMFPYADGGVVSTTTGLIKWFQALTTGKILSPESYDLMTKSYFTVDTTVGIKTAAGYGIYTSELANHKKVIHGRGNIAGVRSEAGYIPEDDLYFAIISNVTQIPNKNESINVDLNSDINKLDIGYFLKYILENTCCK